MRPTAFVLLMLGAVMAGHAHPGRYYDGDPRSHAHRILGLEGSRPGAAASRESGAECNGGPCTLTGGPPGGPNQT